MPYQESKEKMTITELVRSCDDLELLACVALKHWWWKATVKEGLGSVPPEKLEAIEAVFKAFQPDGPEFPHYDAETQPEKIEQHRKEMLEWVNQQT